MMTEPSLNSPLHMVRLLGAPRIEGPAGVLDGPAAQRHRIALLALLATSPHGTLPREKLLGLLWPEASTDNARALLNAAVHAVRHALGKDVLVTHGANLTLDATKARVDLLQFEAAVAAGDVEGALAWYSGPLLDGLFLPDAVEFEHWQDRERARLEDLYHRVLERHAESVAQTRGPRDAVPLWRTRLSCTPTDSRITIRLMQALAEAGDRAGAIHVAEVHSALLQSEFGAEPNPDVQKLAEELRHSPTARAEPLRNTSDYGGPGAGVPSPQPARDAEVANGESDRRADLPTRGEETSRGLTPPVRTRTRQRTRPVTHARAAIALLVLAGGGYSGWRVLRPQGPAGPSTRIAVSWCEATTPDPALAETGVTAAEWLMRALWLEESLDPYPAASVRTLYGGKLANSENPAMDLAREAAAVMLVTCSVSRRGDSLEYRAKLMDPRTGGLLHATNPYRGGLDETLPLQRLAEDVIVAALEYLKVRGQGEDRLPVVSRPASLAAYRALERVRDANKRSEWADYELHLRQLQQLEPGYIWAYYLASGFKYHLGLRTGDAALKARYFAEADSLLSILENRRSELTPEETDNLAWLRAWYDGDKEAERRYMDRLFERSPKRYAYNAAATSYRSGRYNEVLHRLGFTNPDSPWWDRDLVRHWALHQLGRFKDELAAGHDNVARRGLDLHTAVAPIRALATLGRRQGVDSLYNEIVNMPPPDSGQFQPSGSGRIESPPDLLIEAGWEYFTHGHEADARDALERYLRHFDWLPAEERDSLSLAAAQGVIHSQLLTGRLAVARQRLERLREVQPLDAAVLGQAGVAAVLDGDTAEARAIAARLADLGVSAWPSRLPADVALWQSRMAASAGNCDPAERLLRTAFDWGAPYDIWHHRWARVGRAPECTVLPSLFSSRD